MLLPSIPKCPEGISMCPEGRRTVLVPSAWATARACSIIISSHWPFWCSWKKYARIKLSSVGAVYMLFWMEETCEHVSVHWQQGKFQLWANCFKSRSPVSNAGLRISKTLSAAHCYVQLLNHLAMTCLSKTDRHQLNDITHWTQQRVDSQQEWFSTGLLTLSTGI